MFQKIELRKTRDFSAKINATFEFMRQNFKPLAKCLIYISGPFVLLQGLFNGFYQRQILSLGASLSGNPFGIMADALIWICLMMVFGTIGYISSLIVVNEFARLYELKEDPSTIDVPEVWAGVKAKFLSMLGAFIVLFMLIVVAMIFLIIPGIYVAIVVSLIGPIMIIEQKQFGEAFSRCFSLITDKWWSTFGLIFVTGIIVAFMSVVFTIPQYIFLFLTAFQKLKQVDQPLWQQTGMIISSMIQSIGANLLQSIVFMALIFQYYNLVERRESKGLMAKVESFGKAEEPTPRPDETY